MKKIFQDSHCTNFLRQTDGIPCELHKLLCCADSLAVGKINIDEEPQLAGAEGIKVIPTLVLFRNGKAVGSITAPGSKAEIDRFIQETLAK